MRSSREPLAVLALVIGVALLAGAGHADEKTPPTHETPSQASPAEATAQSGEAALRERANGYWKARVAREKNVFDFYLPPEKRIGKGTIQEGGAVRFDSFEIEGVKIEGEIASVMVRVESHIDGRTPFPIPDRIGKRTLTERWEKFDGVWYKQATMPALRAAAADLQRSFERRAAERAAAKAAADEAKKREDAGPGTPGTSAGTGADANTGP